MTAIVNWTGSSGQRYDTELFPIGTQFNAVSGVYIICNTPAINTWQAFYVGEAQSLYDRLNTGVSSHDGFNCATRRGATHISVILARSATERLSIETDLRHGLRPSCNKQSIPK